MSTDYEIIGGFVEDNGMDEGTGGDSFGQLDYFVLVKCALAGGLENVYLGERFED